MNPVKVVAVGGFNLFKFKSKDVLSLLPDDKHEKSANHLQTDKEQVEQTLDTHQEHQTVYITKQRILSTVSSISDPLGFLALFTLKANLLIQYGARNYNGMKIPVELQKLWKRWLQGNQWV